MPESTGPSTSSTAPFTASTSTVLVRNSLHAAMFRSDTERLLGPGELEDALAANTITELWPGIVVAAEMVDEPRTRAAAALLRAGPKAVLSGLTAAAMYGCTAAASPQIEITVPYDRQLRSLPGLSVRQTWIRERDVQELDGLRVFALDITLAELLCNGPQRVALACLEEALAQAGPSRSLQLRALIRERIAIRRDRRGTRQAGALLELAWGCSQRDLAC